MARELSPQGGVVAQTHAVCCSLRDAFGLVVEELHGAWAELDDKATASVGLPGRYGLAAADALLGSCDCDLE